MSSPWDGFDVFSNDDRSQWTWYQTFDNGLLTPNSRGGNANGLITLSGAFPGADFNWVAYLGS